MEPIEISNNINSNSKEIMESFIQQGFIPEENFKLMPRKKKKPKGFQK
jgi:hypothetical protein